MIHVTNREIERAYRQHHTLFRQGEASESKSNLSRGLLLVYAVECGLKAVVMRRERASKTDQIDPLLVSHDIRELLKYLKVNLTIPRARCPRRQRVFQSH